MGKGGNTAQVLRAGARKKYNRADREVNRLRKLLETEETPELLEEFEKAKRTLRAAHEKLAKM